jgi:hypothetical protein
MAPPERERVWSNGGTGRAGEADDGGGEGYNEITLADIVRTLQRRKLVLISVFLVVVLAGVAVTATTAPQYESTATIIPLEHRDIITKWLQSRQAAEHVIESKGHPLLVELFPGRWDGASWDPREPNQEEAGKRLASSVSVGSRGQADERFLEITVRLGNPTLARDVAQGYVESLTLLRPDLENITRQEVFPRYYDGTNEQEARRLAEVEARQKDYWLPLDRADLPNSAVVPNTTLNMALSVVLGMMLGVFGVFLVEWIAAYRSQTRRVDVPAPPKAAQDPDAQKGGTAKTARSELIVERPGRRYR